MLPCGRVNGVICCALGTYHERVGPAEVRPDAVEHLERESALQRVIAEVMSWARFEVCRIGMLNDTCSVERNAC